VTWCNVQQARLDGRNEPAHPTLPFDERPLAQVFPVNRQQVEGVEVRPVSAEQQIKVAQASRSRHDLTVDDRIVRLTACASPSQSCGQCLKLWPLRERNSH
jgi:hypothetical protein